MEHEPSHIRVVVERRFRGPPTSANGGYACGLLAGFVEGTAEVTLRRPPPIEKPLSIIQRGSRDVVLFDGETVIAEATPAIVEVAVPATLSYREATEAAKKSLVLHGDLPYATCFVCGLDRAEGDGLRIFPGPVEGRQIVAAPWVPEASLADDTGTVRSEFLWAALDCPGAFAFIESRQDVVVLGKLAVHLTGQVQEAEKCVVLGWRLGSEGRKLFAGSALLSEGGTLCGVAKATWLRVA